MSANRAWGGRFDRGADALVKSFTASVGFDKMLAPYDIEGSIAHATMLGEQKIISAAEQKSIIEGLKKIRAEIERGDFRWSEEHEDVHMNIEARLIEICGDAGKKLHTGRSRNDQVATDMRLYLRAESALIRGQIRALQKNLLALAEAEAHTIMPGFTHLQAAQPVSLGHHLMAYFEMFDRDFERLENGERRINSMPLGSAALAGSGYPIKREKTAKLLGFESVCRNSIDAVSDRDFVLEFSAAAAIMMMHLSRFCEEIILWSSAQFDFIELDERFCTGSSIMPNKKNPDVAELVRGKSGRINGNLVALLTLMKAQPLAYNRDNQEDKEPLFDTVRTVKNCLEIFTAMLPTIKIKRRNMEKSAKAGHITATDLADYLVKKNIPFRDAHKIVGAAVAFAVKANKDLAELNLAELQKFHPKIENDVFDFLSLKGSLEARDHFGATSTRQVLAAIKTAKKALGQ